MVDQCFGHFQAPQPHRRYTTLCPSVEVGGCNEPPYGLLSLTLPSDQGWQLAAGALIPQFRQRQQFPYEHCLEDIDGGLHRHSGPNDLLQTGIFARLLQIFLRHGLEMHILCHSLDHGIRAPDPLDRKASGFPSPQPLSDQQLGEQLVPLGGLVSDPGLGLAENPAAYALIKNCRHGQGSPNCDFPQRVPQFVCLQVPFLG
mmetsp:Transcript_155063/g.497124  ORF Transcript_155063/g.497124 Transcript_155063/m.497124 type:complete len:201 (+) Transcript_155063:4108-4710(+)